jgi:hypothetical protein
VFRHYVYYRVPAAALPAAVDAATAMQTSLRQRFPGLSTALLRRPEVTAERATLMEVYALSGRELDAEIAAAIEAQATAVLSRWTEGQRHVETFELLAEA